MVTSATALIQETSSGCMFAQLILIFMAVIGLIFAIGVKEDLKRLKFENASKEDGP